MRMLLAALLLATGSLHASVISPFISEIHYDNTGTDVDEFVEISGAGVDFSGWNLLFYNGATGGVYRSLPLTGLLDDSGLGSLAFFPGFTIQNGPADGVALLADTGTVIEFLSYEGSLLAVAGEAAGLTATPLPIEENSLTPLGYSLQRVSLLGDDWVAAEASPGRVNRGLIPVPPTLSLLIAGLCWFRRNQRLA